MDNLLSEAWSQEPNELYERVNDGELSNDVRVEALGALMLSHDSRLPDFFATQLQRDDIDYEWRTILIHAAERTQFVHDETRKAIKSCLLRFARSFRTRGEGGSMSNAWSALRKYSSMVENDDELLPLADFLKEGTLPEIQQIALQSIANVLRRELPKEQRIFRVICDRAYAIARAHIRPDTEPEAAALMICAIDALHTLGDARSSDCVRELLILNSEWYENARAVIEETHS